MNWKIFQNISYIILISDGKLYQVAKTVSFEKNRFE